METKKIFAAVGLLAGLVLTGCQKEASQSNHASQPKTSSPGSSANTFDVKAETNIVSRNLGELTLTNHCETCVSLGAGKDCLFTPKMIDSHNVQLTLAVETKNVKGKIHDLSITQVVTRSGKPFEVAVGDFSFSLTPNVISE